MTFDSYRLLSKTKRKSCNPARFGPEKDHVHESETDVVGQHATIFNDVTKELFTYHYDSQKGVGKSLI